MEHTKAVVRPFANISFSFAAIIAPFFSLVIVTVTPLSGNGPRGWDSSGFQAEAVDQHPEKVSELHINNGMDGTF